MKTIKILIFITSSFFLFACTPGTPKQTKPLYDEVSLKTFVLNTSSTNQSNAINNLDSILNIVSKDSIVFHQTVSFLTEPFSNPNSAYRNQNLYAKLLDKEIGSQWYTAYEKQIAASKLKLLQQNNVGDTANDFTYTTPAGYKKRMYDIKSNFLLLYFNNPECDACKEMKQELISSPIISKKIKNGELTILSIYTDQNEKLWHDHLNEYPAQWMQGRDEDEYLYKNKVYDLRAIPTIYLLDSSKKVLLKDCTDLNQIEQQLQNQWTI